MLEDHGLLGVIEVIENNVMAQRPSPYLVSEPGGEGFINPKGLWCVPERQNRISQFRFPAQCLVDGILGNE